MRLQCAGSKALQLRSAGTCTTTSLTLGNLLNVRDNLQVLFASRRMLHRVLPSSRPRYCFTSWVSEAARGNSRFSFQKGTPRSLRKLLTHSASRFQFMLCSLLRTGQMTLLH